jgi:hypothetical protein
VNRNFRIRTLLILAVLALLALLVQGYHPGVEDDGVYLSAIKKDLQPALYPYDSDFFALQLQATVFDKVVAASVRLTHLPLGWTVFAWQCAAIFLVLWGCWEISRRCFAEWYARWAGVALVAVLLTLPVAGTALYLTDQHLHPRALATAASLFAIAEVLDRRWIRAGLLLAIAFVIHPIMAAFAVSYCVFLAWKPRGEAWPAALAAALPLNWLLEPTSEPWRQAARTRDYFYLSGWHWYEWLGVAGPLILLWWFARIDRGEHSARTRVVSRLVYFGLFQLAVALPVMSFSALDRLKPWQPMRFLHLVYFLFVLFAGGLLGQYVLRSRLWRWVCLFVPLGAVMFYAQRETFPATRHLELPGLALKNQWVGSFNWIRQNTPRDSLFALDPYYMSLPGEDFHSFRALAERSVLADYGKDAVVATQVPRLAPRWQREFQAQLGWTKFQAQDFQRLKETFGVSWVVVQAPGVPGLDCPYRNQAVSVCRVQ